jgi:protocatechuate 3,4-dioxygenase beta subunit
VPSTVRALAGRIVFAAAVVGAAGFVGVGSATPAAAQTCRPTEFGGGGPFQTNAATAPRRSRIGAGHVLAGRVLRYTGCAPVPGAFVEFWQVSANGRYDRRGHGSMVTGRTGAFRFQGPRPPAENGRPPHIHIHVNAAGYEDLVTTYFVPRAARQGRITLVLTSTL